jgi:hypothetical protein
MERREYIFISMHVESCQKLKVLEEGVQEDSYPKYNFNPNQYGTLEGGSPIGDEDGRKDRKTKMTMMMKTMTLNRDHLILISNPLTEQGSPV